ncbi:hypothetical protein Ct61P_10811 [Colletotrichum tofieldiae]|nr:hypothetical protein Ct61P_10811 [Colletotrichum tofieldiae]
MKERIASAMLEVDKLQREIDSVMERQSIYVSSRPSTAHSVAQAAHGKLRRRSKISSLTCADKFRRGTHTHGPRPPAGCAIVRGAPEPRDRAASHSTTPATDNHPPRRMVFTNASAAFITPPPSRGRDPRPPPPPLPLVLRPPLRKKKSFSRVSSWLFPSGAAGQHHQRRISHDSITNFPRPVKDREGFYQCVHAPQGRRASSDSASTVSTSESEDGAQTVPTTWSPSSTLATRAEEPPLERVATFRKEKDVSGSGKTNFAVAF